jgi:16S rRNA (guanine527-N7)-methyltransferase
VNGALGEALSAAGITLSPGAAQALSKYLEYTLAANETQNLTALRSPNLFAAEGIVDSLLAWEAIGAEREAAVVDIGSGSGLPALVWLCAGRITSAHLIEAERRKADFLRSAADALGLAAEVSWGRAEELGRNALRDKAALVTARALAPAPVAIEVCGGLVRPGGRLALLKGRHAEEEAAAGSPVAVRMGFSPAEIVPYALPSGVQRWVLVYRKQRPTPAGRPTSFARLRREFPTRDAAGGERFGQRQGE